MTPDYTEVLEMDAATGEEVKVYICVECKRERFSGDWPQCPHVKGNFGEEPLEPYIDEHLLDHPIEITTRSQRRRIMNEQHFEYRKKRTDLLPSTKAYCFQGK